MRTIDIQASSPYQVLIGQGLLDRLGSHVQQALPGERSLLLLSDERVDALYSQASSASLLQSGYRVHRCVFPGGEQTKTMQSVVKILDRLAECGLTRSDALVALGGGIVGDVGGLAASIYLRGIAFVQVPTTFLAAIDSSVGGKTGVNLSAGKNLAGAFYQPKQVVCSCETFDTLAPETFADGMAEAIKYGMILDEELFTLLARGDARNYLENVVARCVELKNQVVREDERDLGQRQILNFGHTIGHAVETCSGYAITHGHAVAIGMVSVCRAAYRLGLCKQDLTDMLCQALEKNNLPTHCTLPKEALLAAMEHDKKRQGGCITLVLPEKIGRCCLHTMPARELARFLEAGWEERT